MNGAGDHFLAGARLPFQKDGDVRFRRARAKANRALHRLARPREILERENPRRLNVEAAHFGFERPRLERVLDGDLKPLRPDGLDQKIKGTGAHRRSHRLDRPPGRLNDGRRRKASRAHSSEHAHAVEIGHDEIENQEIYGVPVRVEKALNRRLAALERLRAIAEPLDEIDETAALDRIVVDDEDSGRHAASRAGPEGPAERSDNGPTPVIEEVSRPPG